MTTYGTIPTSSHTPTVEDLEYISRAKHRIKSGLSTRRPWKSMFDFTSINFPNGISDAITRIKTNLGCFRVNYAIVVLSILFVSLIFHPTSLFVLAVLIIFWIFLYFLRDEPLKVLSYRIDDGVVVIVLLALTVFLLMLTDASATILVSVVIAAVLVVIHAVMRRSDNLLLDEEVAAAAAATETSGLMSYP